MGVFNSFEMKSAVNYDTKILFNYRQDAASMLRVQNESFKKV